VTAVQTPEKTSSAATKSSDTVISSDTIVSSDADIVAVTGVRAALSMSDDGRGSESCRVPTEYSTSCELLSCSRRAAAGAGAGDGDGDDTTDALSSARHTPAASSTTTTVAGFTTSIAL
jgi:hypothetical protein